MEFTNRGDFAPEVFKELSQYVSQETPDIILGVGSDAHSAEDLGRGIAGALALAREAGFEAVTLFEKREPRQLRII